MSGVHVEVIGAGAIARRHAAAAARFAGVTLAVADPNPVALAAFLAEHPHARGFSDAAAMLSTTPAATAIAIVATPPWTHRALVEAAVARGRHVLCEKPMAMTRADAVAMGSAAAAADRVLACCSVRFLGTPTLTRVRAALEDGVLGVPYRFTFVQRHARQRSGIEYQPETSWFLDASKSGGGVGMDWGPYDVAHLVALLDPVRVDVRHAWTARVVAGEPPPPTVVDDVEHHWGAAWRVTRRDGSVVEVHYERAAATHGAERDVCELEGTAGAVGWDWLCLPGSGDIVWRDDSAGGPRERVERVEDASGVHHHDRPLHALLASLTGSASLSVVGGRAVAQAELLRATYDAAATGREQSVAFP